MKASGLAVAAAVLLIAGTAPAFASPRSTGIRVVANHLNNPRGLELGADGSLYVSEAGTGGKRCYPTPIGPQCGGFSSAILRVAGGSVTPYATGFFSGGSRDGSFAVGMDDVAVSPSGSVYAIVTSVGRRPERLGAAVAAQSGMLFRVDRGRKAAVANVSAYEFAHNPDGANVDSDPYSVAWTPFGLAVTDAAGNSLLAVGPGGRVTTIATFPAQRFGGHAAQSVPTSVVWHDGAFYVGELGGDGTPAGRSRVWRVVPGERPSVFARGFSAVGGIAFGPDGSLYVSELSKQGLGGLEKGRLVGAVVRVRPDGRREELAVGRLAAPSGIAVAADGTVFVSVNSIFPRRGQVLAIGQPR